MMMTNHSAYNDYIYLTGLYTCTNNLNKLRMTCSMFGCIMKFLLEEGRGIGIHLYSMMLFVKCS